MTTRLLLLETSHQPGLVAIAEDDRVIGQRHLELARRHTRDLVPATKALLEVAAWSPRELNGVIVGIGPGSYTGLRVGIMSAKTLAYATGCTLIGVETFAVIARQVTTEANCVAVLADAQQGKIYVQHFTRSSGGWVADDALAIRSFAEWLTTSPDDVWVTGPGLETFLNQLPARRLVAPRPDWAPSAESLLDLGLATFRAGHRDDSFALEPLYLRPSSAEENWRKRKLKSE